MIATNTNQESTNQGKLTPGSMHHCGAANVTILSLSQMFCHTYVMFHDSCDDDSTQSFGRTLLKCLWPLLLFLALCPGRDTQDDGLTYCVGNVHGPYYMSCFINLLSSAWSIFATTEGMALGILYAAFYHSMMGNKIQDFERKHGQWRLTKILPIFLMVLLCINVTSVQAAGLQVHSVHPVKTKVPHVSSVHLAFLFDKWKELLDTCSAFNKLLESIDQPQLFQVDQHHANESEEFLAHEALCCSCQGKFAEELFPDPKGVANKGAVPHSQDVPSWTEMTMVEEIDNLFTLSSSVAIHHVPKDISLELESLLINLPRNQVCLYPASLASVELVPKLPHLLWSACSKGNDHQVDFGILLDTSCSVATTRYDEDFCGQLAYGCFGVIKTANGMAEIKGFGVVHWETMDANCNTALIKVPAYYVPTVEMCLLSPQDYTHYNKIEIKHSCSDNANFMQLQIATPDHLPGKQTSTVKVHANICMGACLPFLAGSCHVLPSHKEQFGPGKSAT